MFRIAASGCSRPSADHVSLKNLGQVTTSEHATDATAFASVCVGVDEACGDITRQTGVPAVSKSRIRMRDEAGINHGRFYNAVGAKDGEPAKAASVLRDRCRCWSQMKSLKTARVIFHTHAAAKTGSLASAGIDITFDKVIIDESPSQIFFEDDKFTVEGLPDYGGRSKFCSDAGEYDKKDDIACADYAAKARRMIDYFLAASGPSDGALLAWVMSGSDRAMARQFPTLWQAACPDGSNHERTGR